VADRAWRRALTRPTKRPTQVEPPRQVVFDDDDRLDVFGSDKAGLVPISDGSTVKFLRGDGAFAALPTFVTPAQFASWLTALRAANPLLTIPDLLP